MKYMGDYNAGMREYEREHLAKSLPKGKKTGRWRKIYWIGRGSNSSGLHTKEEFLTIMRNQYPDRIYWRMRGDKVVPYGKIKRNDIEGWMEFADAKWV